MRKKLAEFFSLLNGFRKLIICFLVLVTSIILLVTKYISAEIFSNIITVVIPSYFATNVGEHFTDTLKDWLKTRGVVKND